MTVNPPMPPWGDWFADHGDLHLVFASTTHTYVAVAIEDLYQNFKARLKDELEVTNWDPDTFGRCLIGELTER